MYHNRLDVTTMLGKILFDSDGNIIAAEAASILFVLKDEEEVSSHLNELRDEISSCLPELTDDVSSHLPELMR
jgi:hypothetical protein